MSTTTLIAIAIILSIALIVAAIVTKASNKAKKKKSQLQNEINKVAQEANLQVTQTQNYRNRMVALDETSGYVVYAWYADNAYQSQVTDLSKVNKWELVKVGNKITETSPNGKKTVEEHVREIQLQLHTRDNTVCSIVFYNEMEDSSLDMLIHKQTAEEWKKRIEQLSKATML
jgi:type II secretory pathway pseudopilin PulG